MTEHVLPGNWCVCVLVLLQKDLTKISNLREWQLSSACLVFIIELYVGSCTLSSSKIQILYTLCSVQVKAIWFANILSVWHWCELSAECHSPTVFGIIPNSFAWHEGCLRGCPLMMAASSCLSAICCSLLGHLTEPVLQIISFFVALRMALSRTVQIKKELTEQLILNQKA